MTDCVALIVAAGRGTRFGGDVPKQYRTLAGAPVLRHAVLAFLDHRQVDAVRVLIHPDDRPLYDAAVGDLHLLPPVHGGETRQDSALLGLDSLVKVAPERVLIHDAARPFVSADTIGRVIDALESAPAALPGVAVRDTLKRGSDDAACRVTGTVDRFGLWRAQTPQGFRYPELLDAHRQLVGAGFTDDAAVAEAFGLAVAIVEGDEDNFKITTEDDLARAERMLAATMETRTGIGFDVHRFGPGDHVMLCGVTVPHDAGLVGHSDADVGLHALTDALLGAIADGDIGSHFPPSDPRWRGVASATFVRHAANRVRHFGGRIIGVDLAIICERPKVAPHREEMRQEIAALLGVAVERVSVKATTTEGLGFTGRREGIAAQATATVQLPVSLAAAFG